MEMQQPDLWDYLPPPERLMTPSEIFDQADAALIRKLVEGRRIERKSASFSGAPLGEYICMWTNTAPDGGVIAVGVHDNGECEGCMKLSQSQVNKLEITAQTYCPDAVVKVREMDFETSDGKRDFILLFRVKYHPEIVVRTVAGRIFRRIADTIHEVKTPEEIRELQADKGEISFERRDSGLEFPVDFNESGISRFVSNIRTARKLSDSLTTKEILNLRHLGKIDGVAFRPNYACALLFGKDPLGLIPGCKIHFQRFEGEEEKTGREFNAVKDLFLEGNVQELVRQTEELLLTAAQ
jgi:ATP-dependent DNA helicase RecG